MLVENMSVPRDRRVWQEARTLADAGYAVSVVSPSGGPGETAEQETLNGVSIHRFPNRSARPGTGPLGYAGEYGHALRQMRRLALSIDAVSPIDVVHLSNPPDVLFLAVGRLRRRGAKIVFDHHDLVPELYEVRFGRQSGAVLRAAGVAERRSFHLADVVISTNESYRRIAIERGGRAPADVFVVRNAPDLDRFRATAPDPALRRGRAHLLAYAGTIGPQDGVDCALRALRLLADRRDDWHAIVAGDGDSAESMRSLAADLSLAERVEFTGFLGDSELIRLLSSADVCLSPEPSNPLNNVSTMIKVVEYMALGQPIVAFDLPETRYSAGDAALYARPNDEDAFADGIEQLLDDRLLRERMGATGRRRVEGELSWSRSVEQLLAAYEHVLGSRSSGRRGSDPSADGSVEAAGSASGNVVDLEDAEWHAFVSSSTEATPFHHPDWARVLADCYHLPAFAVAVRDEQGKIAAGLPVIETRGLRSRRWVALPFTDCCPPLGPERWLPYLSLALDDLRVASSIAAAEVRGAMSDDNARTVVMGVTHRLPLNSDPESVLARLHPSQVQRSIAKAEREGVSVRRGETKADLTEIFYELHLMSRRRMGVPIQPRRFFELLWDHVLDPGLGFVLIAEHRSRPVAAAVFLSWNQTLVYKFGASDHRHLACRPNHAVLWRAIVDGCENGYQLLDFGLTETHETGLRSFKSRWGTTESEVVCSVYGEAQGVRQRPPTMLTSVVRYSPPWVCRTLGELLYRHAA
jgi:glycosyltransferase involved in cell wall biosynthesis/CelD/BcsL family acetyltransferase involved in cellulose biosynthesis